MKISQKLYIRVALSIAIVALLVSMASAAISYMSNLDEKKDTNYLLVQQLAETVQKTAAISAYIGDFELGNEIVNGLLSNDLVKGVSLSGQSDMLITLGQNVSQSEPILLKLMNPFVQEDQVGTLSIFPDDKYIQQQARNASEKAAILMLIHSTIIAFFVSIVVHRRLTRPIQSLTDDFAKIDPSLPETMQKITIRGGARDEISRLVVGINSLMRELQLTINNERELRKKTQELESEFRLIFEQASAGICLLDAQNMISTYNPAFESYFTASDAKTLSSLHFPTLLNDVDKLQELLHEIRSKDGIGQITLDIEFRLGNQTKWMHCLFAKLTEQRTGNRSTQEGLIEVILHDVTERAEREFQTRFEADHDPLTHLLNRRSGEKKLHKALFDSIKKQHKLVLMMIDLDKFKPVNDTFGHEAGDKVLVEIARRIKTRFYLNTDICIRWGGDEFVIARRIEHFNIGSSQTQAENMLQDIIKPIQLSEFENCEIGASIGIVVGPDNGKVLHELMVNADNTMYKVKERGRGQVAFYEKS